MPLRSHRRAHLLPALRCGTVHCGPHLRRRWCTPRRCHAPSAHRKQRHKPPAAPTLPPAQKIGRSWDRCIMTQNTPRPAAPESDVPIAYSRIVIGHKNSFVYIPFCPLCGLEHMHGQYPLHGPYNDPAEAYEACHGHRASHCGPHGLGRIMRRIGGERCNGYRDPPPEYHEPRGGSYRLVMAYPACFTPLGVRSKAARHLMDALARRGFPTSLEILKPRRKFVLRRGG
jgi:hypothetical protein